MKIGTKSLLFGAHQFIWHPLLVAIAWARLFGFPTDLRLWVAFVTHDWGYIGCENMDGPEGKRHPEGGARLMGRLFGAEWASFTRRHSRSYARMEGRPVSALAAADKYATAIEPRWFYLWRVKLTGEINEYLSLNPTTGDDSGVAASEDRWVDEMRAHFKAEAERIAREDGGVYPGKRVPRVFEEGGL